MFFFYFSHCILTSRILLVWGSLTWAGTSYRRCLLTCSSCLAWNTWTQATTLSIASQRSASKVREIFATEVIKNRRKLCSDEEEGRDPIMSELCSFALILSRMISNPFLCFAACFRCLTFLRFREELRFGTKIWIFLKVNKLVSILKEEIVICTWIRKGFPFCWFPSDLNVCFLCGYILLEKAPWPRNTVPLLQKYYRVRITPTIASNAFWYKVEMYNNVRLMRD